MTWIAKHEANRELNLALDALARGEFAAALAAASRAVDALEELAQPAPPPRAEG